MPFMLVFPLKKFFVLVLVSMVFCYSDLWWGNVPKWKPVKKPSLSSKWSW